MELAIMKYRTHQKYCILTQIPSFVLEINSSIGSAIFLNIKAHYKASQDNQCSHESCIAKSL
jgi:hypothetical protein